MVGTCNVATPKAPSPVDGQMESLNHSIREGRDLVEILNERLQSVMVQKPVDPAAPKDPDPIGIPLCDSIQANTIYQCRTNDILHEILSKLAL